MKRSIVAILLATTFTLTAPSPTQAVSLVREDSQRTSVQNETEEQKRIELDAKKLELDQKVAEKRAAISEKLRGDRVDKCLKKQDTINSMLDNRVIAAQRHLDKFKSIQDKLTTFVKEKELSVENEAPLQLIMSDLHRTTQASITSLGTDNFDCKTADAVSPGKIVKDQVSLVKQSLKDYRDAIKDYSVAIKSSIAPVTETPAEESETTEQSADGAQQ